MTSLSIFAPAKINLDLRIGPPGADGRHPLNSLVAFADVGDTLIMEAGAPALTLGGPFAAALEGENLITRALDLIGCRARVHLEKQLPVASGIGGGSSDAAAALRGANALREQPLPLAALMEIAARLGSDVPVCLAAQPALMSGTGEQVTPVNLAPLFAVLVNPGVAAPTGPVYRMFDEMGLGGNWDADEGGELSARAHGGRNDLEAPALRLQPAIGEVLDRLAAAPERLAIRMSGSGATCFALTPSAEAAASLAGALAEERPQWWARAARLGAVDVTPRWR